MRQWGFVPDRVWANSATWIPTPCGSNKLCVPNEWTCARSWELNPADLLTKHSLTRDKLDYLVRLFGCEYIGGRAESAPQLRQGVTGKTTVAEADNPGNDNDHHDHHNNHDTNDNSINSTMVPGDCEVREDSGTAWMPHNELNASDLDLRFPPIEAPEENEYEDLVKDEDDGLLKHGVALAQRIVDEMVANGRTRVDPLAAPSSSSSRRSS